MVWLFKSVYYQQNATIQIDILQPECECAQRCVDSVDIDTVNADFWGTLY